MKFNVVIGNPPYQEEDSNNKNSLSPIYQNFIEKALSINSDNTIFIVPSRWMQGGKNLDTFRYRMINETIPKVIIDYKDSKSAFPSVDIDNGICILMHADKNNKLTKYIYIDADNQQYNKLRNLSEENSDFIIRDIRQLNIIEKIKQSGDLTFDIIVSTRSPYGIMTDLFNDTEKYKHCDLQKNLKDTYIKIYGVEGFKGGAVRTEGYIKPSSITKGFELLNKYNIFFSVAYRSTALNPPQRILSNKNEICTETFLNIGPFNTKEEQLNCEEYIKTKFFRALLYFHRFQKNTTHKTFEFIPLVSFDRTWTDEELYKRYNLNNDEIQYIENLFKKG